LRSESWAVCGRREGFWKSLDTLKDKNDFNKMIKKNKMPWKNI